MRKFEYLLFDLDNTLLDFSASSKEAFKVIFESHPFINFDDDYKVYSGINKKVWEDLESGNIDEKKLKTARWSMFFKAKGISDLDPSETNKRYFDFIGQNPIFVKGAEDILSELKKVDYPMAIITNGLAEVQWPRLKLSGIVELFTPIVISNEIGFAKPDNRFFQYTYDRLEDVDKSRVLVIGDTINSDIKGGNDFGFQTCWFKHKKCSVVKEGESKPDHIINDITELLSIVL